MFENKERKIEPYKHYWYGHKPAGYIYLLIRSYCTQIYHEQGPIIIINHYLKIDDIFAYNIF